MAALQQPHRRDGAQHPGQLGHLRHVGLPEEHRPLRVEAAGEEIQRHVERVLAALGGVDQRGHRVIIGDEIERLALLLQLDGGLHHPEVIAEMQRARRLNAG